MKNVYIILISIVLILSQSNIDAKIFPSHQNNTHTQYTFILPDYDLNNQRWIPHWAMISEPGKPQLPQTGFLFQSNERISIDIIEIKETKCIINDVPPEPKLFNSQSLSKKDRQVYESDQFFPSDIFHIDPPSKWSGTNVVRILVRPFQWNPVTQELRIIHEMTFSIHRKNQAFEQIKQSRITPNDTIKSQVILNYSPSKKIFSARKKTTSLQNQKLNLFIHTNAMYRLTYSDLEQYQFPVSQKPLSYLQLWHNGNQIPLYINGKASYFQPNDSIVFFGQAINSAYTNINVYQLFWGETPGMRMSTKVAAPNHNGFAEYAWHTVSFEENSGDNFWPATPGAPENDFVFWDLLTAPDSFTTTFDLPHLNLLASDTTSQFGIVFQEKTNSFHNIKILINDHTLFQKQFDADSLFKVEIPLKTDILKPQNNTLIVQSELNSGVWTDKLYMNKFVIQYPVSFIVQNNEALIETDQQAQNLELSGFTTTPIRIFDISNPMLPEIFTKSTIIGSGSNYQVQFFNDNANTLYVCTESMYTTPEIKWASSEALKSTKNCAEYMIITPKKYIPAVQPLMDYYCGQGVETMVVSPDEIFDTFNGGLVHPQSVKAFLSYAFHHWKTSPSYALLVGDSNIDYLDYFQTGKQNDVPVYLTYMDSVGLAPNDHYYVCLDGDDLYPEMAIGRIPGKNISDIEKMVMKRLNYSKSHKIAGQRNLFISDNDADNIFANICERSLNYLSDRMKQVHLAFTEQSDLDTFTGEIIQYLNHGALIAAYIGHGSIDNWAGEPLLHANDIQRIDPDTPLTFYVSLNCMSGYFALPDRYSLSQKLMLPETKGAIGIFAPTAMAQVWEIEIMAQSLFSLIRSNPNLPIGDLVMGTKIASFAKGIRASTVQMFTLTGDPMVKLNFPLTSIPGDFDTDGHLTLKDIIMILKHLGN